MLKTLLLKFWPALIPILIYILVKWWVVRNRKKQEENIIIDVNKKWYHGEIFWVTLLSMLTLVACFIIFIVYGEYGESGDYTPPQFIEGNIVPGHIK